MSPGVDSMRASDEGDREGRKRNREKGRKGREGKEGGKRKADGWEVAKDRMKMST